MCGFKLLFGRLVWGFVLEVCSAVFTWNFHVPFLEHVPVIFCPRSLLFDL